MHDGCLWLEEPIPITNHLIDKITRLPCKGEDPTNISKGKIDDLAIAQAIKKKFKLEKKKQGHAISSIKKLAFKVVTQILARKVMRKCHADEVPAPMVAVAVQCAEGVQFNWVNYQCDEFLVNYRKA